MRILIALISVAMLMLTATAATAATRRKATTQKRLAAKAPSRKYVGKTARTGRSGKRSRTVAKKGQTWRSRQLAPAPERYQDIQQALIGKGYLEGPATGNWDSASIAALRRFQQEQNLEPTGKIDSLSLIALGLGPKYDTAATGVPRPPQP